MAERQVVLEKRKEIKDFLEYVQKQSEKYMRESCLFREERHLLRGMDANISPILRVWDN